MQRCILHHSLETLRIHTHYLAATYRTVGLVFYSLPAHIIWDNDVARDIRRHARTNFKVNTVCELPEMIQILGTLSFTLEQVSDCLAEDDFDRAERLCMGADGLVREGFWKVESLRQAVNVFLRVRYILALKGWKELEPPWSRERRQKMRRAWVAGLPIVCWEGEREEKLETVAEE